MKKFERKARLKAMKAAQKAAKRAARDEAGEAPSMNAAEVSPVAAPDGPALVESTTGTDPNGGDSPLSRTPHMLPAFAVDDAVEEAALAHAVAGNMYANSKLVSEDEAAGMLSNAARLLDEVVAITRRTLAMVPPQRLAKAAAVLKAERVEAGGTPQQRPRRGYDPVITLMKTGVAASSLLQRVLNRLHPKLRKAA